jgi:hypothetical protein
MNTSRIRNGPLRIARISRTGVVILILLVNLLPIGQMVQPAYAAAPDIEAWHNLTSPPKWSGGTTVQQSNSKYGEGDSLPFRYTHDSRGQGALQGGSTYRVILKWEHLFDDGAPIEAFIDYLTTYTATETTVTGHAFDSLTCTTLSTEPIPADSGANEPSGVTLPPAALNPGDTQVFDLCNITIIGFSNYVSLPPSGNRIVRTLEVTYEVLGTGDQDVGIAFGGHLAEEAFWGQGNGAGNFPGASPQVLVNQSEACTLAEGGDPDNASDWECTQDTSDKNININPNAAMPRPRIIIVKDADPNGLQDFQFTGDLGDFTLDDDAGVVGAQDPPHDTEIFLGIDPGQYSITEQDTPGWDLASITCTGTEIQSGGAFPPDVTQDGSTIDITVELDQEVRCVFLNTEVTEPALTIDKECTPATGNSPGDVVHCTIDYANTGNADATHVTIVDDYDQTHGSVSNVTDGTHFAAGTDNADTITWGPATVPAETSGSVSYDYTLSGAGSFPAGTTTVRNTATIDSDQTDPVDDEETIKVETELAIDVDKTAAPTSVNEPGGEVEFTVQVTNTGDKTVTLNQIADDEDDDGTDDTFYAASVICDQTVLAPGETATCTFTRYVSGNAGDVITDEATASGTDDDGNPVSDSDTATVDIEGPTAITLASFTAEAGADGVTLAWETGTEIDNAGFNLYRAKSPDGPYIKLNAALIAAGGDPVAGATYSFLDEDLAPGTYTYELEDVDLNGVTTRHGPVSATVSPGLRRPAYRPMWPGF